MPTTRSISVRLEQTETVLALLYLVEIENGDTVNISHEITMYNKGEKKEVARIVRDGVVCEAITLPPIVSELIKENHAHGTVYKESWFDRHGQQIKSTTPKPNEKHLDLVPA